MGFMKRIVPLLLILLLLPVFGVHADGDGQLIAQGDKGEEVVRIQTRLFDLGYYTYKPTGSFQTVTKSAVIAYQAASGLMSDGTVGRESQNALFSRGARRVPFRAEVPVSFSAQGAITQKGNASAWDSVKRKLVPDGAYTVRNAATGEEATLVFVEGENHAEMSLSAVPEQKKYAETMLKKWLGDTNSFYKCAVLLDLDGQWIAASLQWNGSDRACLYFKDSLSHVHGLPDAEHEANIRKVSY